MSDLTPAAPDNDSTMIDTLRACGFFVRTEFLVTGQRPQVVGTIDNAMEFFKLTVSGTDAAVAAAFAPFLKEGETPIQRLEREIRDSSTLAAMLAQEREKALRYAPAAQAAPSPHDAIDAARLAKLLQTCTQANIKYHASNRPRQITFVIKDSVTTSKGFREELRKTLDEFQPIDIVAPLEDGRAELAAPDNDGMAQTANAGSAA